jgi:Zn-dependent protease with chaperone function
MRWMVCPLFVLALCVTVYPAAAGQPQASSPASVNQMPDVTKVPTAALPSPTFDVTAATNAYIAQIPAAATARSDAYFEGGYWISGWNFLCGVAVALVLLFFGWSAAFRNLAERVTRRKPLQTGLYWIQYLAVTSLLSFPLVFYTDYVREHQYGMATQSLGPWLGDQAKGFMVGLVLGGILAVVLFGLVRRLARTWWIWGALVTMLFLVVTAMIGPVYLQPIFNNVTRLNDPAVTGPILSLARANGIPAQDVWEIDASRQTTRMSANVSGLGSTLRITLNDNLLRRGSPEEIQAVMAHEMGHYVLNHVPKMIMFFLIVVVVAFAWLRWSLTWCLERWGERWKVRGVGDTAVLPLVVLLVAVYGFVLTPLMNTFTRSQEYEADMYGLNAARQPDGFAQAAIHLGEYRKMHPGALEEWIFYDHPSGYNRIYAAMRWKKENLRLFASQNPMNAPTSH